MIFHDHFSELSLDILCNVYICFLEEKQGTKVNTSRIELRNQKTFEQLRELIFPIVSEQELDELEKLEDISYSQEYRSTIKYGAIIFLPTENNKEDQKIIDKAWSLLQKQFPEPVPIEKLKKRAIVPIHVDDDNATILFKDGIPMEGLFLVSYETAGFIRNGEVVNRQIEENAYSMLKYSTGIKISYVNLLREKVKNQYISYLEDRNKLQSLPGYLFSSTIYAGQGLSERNTSHYVKNISFEYFFYKYKKVFLHIDEVVSLRKAFVHEDIRELVFPPSYANYPSWRNKLVQYCTFNYERFVNKGVSFQIPLEIDSFFVHFGLIALNEYRSAINTIDVLKRGRLAKITFIVRERLDELRAAFQEQLNKDNQSLIFEQDMFVFDMENAENGNKNFYWFHLEKEGDSPSFYSYNGETKEIQLDFSSFSEYVEKKAYRQILLKEDFGEYFFNAVEEDVQQSILRYLQKRYGEDIAFR